MAVGMKENVSNIILRNMHARAGELPMRMYLQFQNWYIKYITFYLFMFILTRVSLCILRLIPDDDDIISESG